MTRLVIGVVTLFVAFAGLPGAALAGEVGYFDPADSTWYLPDSSGTVSQLAFGSSGHVPVAGDWDCDGVDTPGMYDPGTGRAYFKLALNSPGADVSFHFGVAGDVPLVGDWDGDGCDGFGVYRPSTGQVYLADSPSLISSWEYSIGAGLPFVIDHDGDGREEVTTYQRATDLANFDPEALDGHVIPAPDRVVHDGQVLSRQELELTRALERIVPVSGNFGSCGDGCGGLYPTLQLGDRGRWVTDLRSSLASLGFRPGEGDEYDKSLAGAVLAFEKYHGLERDGVFDRSSWELLGDALQVPFRADTPTRVEVDLGRQILFLIIDHQLAGVIPVSSASGNPYTSWDGETRTSRTPEGQFELYREEDGWYRSYLGSLYEPFFFRGGYAIHGSNNVPGYPASAGCIRTQVWDQDWLKPQLDFGMAVFVYGDRTDAPEI